MVEDQPTQGAAEAKTVTVGITSRTIFNLPVWIAQRLGYFRDEGLDVGVQLFLSGDDSRQALQSGAIQVAFAPPEAVLVDVYLRNGPLRIVGGNARRLPHFIIAQPRYKTLADLRGAVFGVISMEEGTTYILPAIANAAGLQPGDYTVSAVGGAPARWQLLQEGKIDVGLQPFPLSYQAEAAGFSNLGWTGDHEPEWQFTSINTDSRWASSNRPTLVSLLRAFRRGSDFMASNPDEAAEIGAEEMRSTVPFTARSLQDNTRLGCLDPKLDWSEQGIARIFEILQETAVIPRDATFDIGRLVDRTFLEASRH